ncbi:P-loop containing nucleoside triphosphate hydrolase protein [Gonapodya prolifera JEL478]|uniref:RNA helicase n=1 Tax=Gonapodya prolifera (strain JEL478) TaxID=1344416 RepID=A0A138ZXT4_GONPJ|nr:P-loop containing nucleoside triphosphate hydrolase protein [Gonapodya prolifera JEL478]|eukprot:KXS09304.1 P-loop containing nucleoside triphosphate hydrolase protein [Gonapodya prolifera JEL478]
MEADDPIQTQRRSLPIYEYRDALIEALEHYPTLVVVGDTGSGKTTQVPQYLLEAFGGDGKLRVAVTQPRRIAAISAAQRVSQELRQPKVGLRVGYKIRFEAAVGNDTELIYMTDGVLLREACTDPTLSAYHAIVIDEAHERSLDTDVLLGLLKRARRARPDLRLLVMSATLDVDKFSAFFDDAPCFSVPGRTFEVDIFFQKKIKIATLKSTFVQRAVDTAMHIHATRPMGHILVFLTGQDDIETAVRRATEADRALDYTRDISDRSVRGVRCLPVYSALESGEQRAIFDEAGDGLRKIVFATNIAQTSITIPGIRYVVDSGFVKQNQYDPATGMDGLLVVPISKSAATQRSGRAGRTTHGECYRLYSRDSFDELDAETVPEIQRTSLLAVVLDLKKMGVKDVLGFEFIDPPERNLEVSAIRQLFLLGALTPTGDLTRTGDHLSAFPISPFLSRALLSASQEYRCARELLTICAFLSIESIWLEPRDETKRDLAARTRREFAHPSGDHMTLVRVWDAFQDSGEDREWCKRHFIHHRAVRTAGRIRDQLVGVMSRLGLDTSGSCRVRRSNGDMERERDRDRDGKRRRGWAAPDGEYDPVPVIKSLCTALYPNAAKRYGERGVFYGYAGVAASRGPGGSGSGGGSGGGTGTGTGTRGQRGDAVALFMHPQSALWEEGGEYGGLEWVVFHDVVYTNRATMRHVSQVDWSWISPLVSRLSEIDEEKLTGRTVVETSGGEGGEGGAGEASRGEEGQKEGDREEEKAGEVERKRKQKEEEEEQRDARVREARERYAARKKART